MTSILPAVAKQWEREDVSFIPVAEVLRHAIASHRLQRPWSEADTHGLQSKAL